MFLGISHVLLEIYEIELRPASKKGNTAVILYACLDWLTSSHFHCEIWQQLSQQKITLVFDYDLNNKLLIN